MLRVIEKMIICTTKINIVLDSCKNLKISKEVILEEHNYKLNMLL